MYIDLDTTVFFTAKMPPKPTRPFAAQLPLQAWVRGKTGRRLLCRNPSSTVGVGYSASLPSSTPHSLVASGHCSDDPLGNPSVDY